eukprot:TRINITY_DN5854_c1_g2_i1.p1 TRINITY_DN5854_c1_g2~~TRINITY_DN5854_c1_g2_i1.p1  ORF type:complete len:225 (+),score=24.07 TRINITY_DN5854_c1_g2_i1:85-759(+)
MTSKRFLMAELPKRLHGRVTAMSTYKPDKTNLVWQRYGAENYTEDKVDIERTHIETSYLERELPDIETVISIFCNEMLQGWLMTIQRWRSMPSAEITAACESNFPEGAKIGSATVVMRKPGSILIEITPTTAYGFAVAPSYNKKNELTGYMLEVSRYSDTGISSFQRWYTKHLVARGTVRMTRKYSDPVTLRGPHDASPWNPIFNQELPKDPEELARLREQQQR